VDLVQLTALIRRVVESRLGDLDVVDDIVQETIVRLLAARTRLDEQALGPYGMVIARNLIASHRRRTDMVRRFERRARSR
jgi:DNA-directed RNA polymerase specialized sigma24 family protein